MLLTGAPPRTTIPKPSARLRKRNLGSLRHRQSPRQIELTRTCVTVKRFRPAGAPPRSHRRETERPSGPVSMTPMSRSGPVYLCHGVPCASAAPRSPRRPRPCFCCRGSAFTPAPRPVPVRWDPRTNGSSSRTCRVLTSRAARLREGAAERGAACSSVETRLQARSRDVLALVPVSTGCRFGRRWVHVLAELVSKDLPLVLLARDPIPGAEAVNAENEATAYALATHLVRDHGYDSLAFLGDADTSSDTSQRWHGFRRALRDAQVPVADRPTPCAGDERSGRQGAAHLLGERRPRALVCTNDEIALGAITAAEGRACASRPTFGAGWDDGISARPSVPLTTVRQPMRELEPGCPAVARATAGKRENHGTSAATQLVLRASVDPLRGGSMRTAQRRVADDRSGDLLRRCALTACAYEAARPGGPEAGRFRRRGERDITAWRLARGREARGIAADRAETPDGRST